MRPAMRRSELCAYCNERDAISRDHVVPKSMVKKGKPFSAARRHALNRISEELLMTVPSCGPCNWRKGTRKLVPPSWEDKIPLLKEAIPGQWRTWDGDPMSPAFRLVHK